MRALDANTEGSADVAQRHASCSKRPSGGASVLGCVRLCLLGHQAQALGLGQVIANLVGQDGNDVDLDARLGNVEDQGSRLGSHRRDLFEVPCLGEDPTVVDVRDLDGPPLAGGAGECGDFRCDPSMCLMILAAVMSLISVWRATGCIRVPTHTRVWLPPSYSRYSTP